MQSARVRVNASFAADWVGVLFPPNNIVSPSLAIPADSFNLNHTSNYGITICDSVNEVAVESDTLKNTTKHDIIASARSRAILICAWAYPKYPFLPRQVTISKRAQK